MGRWWNDTDRGVWSVGGMILTGEKEVLKQNPTPLSLCPPNISHGLVRDRTQTPPAADSVGINNQLVPRSKHIQSFL